MSAASSTILQASPSTPNTWRARKTSRRTSPVAYQIQGYKLNRAIFNPTAARLGQAIAGEMSLDDALKRISMDIDEQVKAAAK